MPNFLLTNESTKRLLFRKVTLEDFESWLPFHENPLSNQYWTGLPKDPKVACAEQLHKTLKRYENYRGGLNALISKKTKRLIGLSGLLVQEVNGKKELEIGYSVLPQYWRQGYAYEAAKKCKEVAFSNSWETSLISIIQIDNIPSQRTALKNGMQIDFKTIYFDNPVYIFRVTK